MKNERYISIKDEKNKNLDNKDVLRDNVLNRGDKEESHDFKNYEDIRRAVKDPNSSVKRDDSKDSDYSKQKDTNSQQTDNPLEQHLNII